MKHTQPLWKKKTVSEVRILPVTICKEILASYFLADPLLTKALNVVCLYIEGEVIAVSRAP